MRVVPVIDLKQGQVVHAVAGRRDEYRPMKSLLCDGSSPAAVGAAFRRLGFTEVYVADLDAIAGGLPDDASYEQLLACDLRLCLDAGVATPQRASDLKRFFPGDAGLTGIVVGLESIDSLPGLIATKAEIAPARLVFSLDLRNGRPLCRVREWQTLSAEAIANEVVGLGARRMIVLDLAAVGTGEGVSTLALCGRLKRTHAHVEIMTGGGVRDTADLDRLAAAGCDAALVASAIHDGRLISAPPV